MCGHDGCSARLKNPLFLFLKPEWYFNKQYFISFQGPLFGAIHADEAIWTLGN